MLSRYLASVVIGIEGFVNSVLTPPSQDGGGRDGGGRGRVGGGAGGNRVGGAAVLRAARLPEGPPAAPRPPARGRRGPPMTVPLSILHVHVLVLFSVFELLFFSGLFSCCFSHHCFRVLWERQRADVRLCRCVPRPASRRTCAHPRLATRRPPAARPSQL